MGSLSRLLGSAKSAGFGGIEHVVRPIVPEDGGTLELRGRELRASGDNASGIFDLRGLSSGGIIKCGMGGVLNGVGQAPAFLMDEETGPWSIQGLEVRDASDPKATPSADETWTTALIGGNMFTQTGGGSILQDCLITRTRIEFAGVGHRIRRCRSIGALTTAFSMGTFGANGGSHLPWDNWHRKIACDCVLSDLYVEGAWATGAGSTDGGVLYAGRSLAALVTFERVSGKNCGGCFVYGDDVMSNLRVRGARTISGCGRALRMGGGFGNVVQAMVASGDSLASEWDDRGNANMGVGGGGQDHFNHGGWHAWAHNGAASTHGATSCAASASMQVMQIEHDLIVSAGKETWLAAVNARYAEEGLTYEGLWTGEATLATSGRLDFRYLAGTPQIENGLGSTVLGAGVKATVAPV